MKADLSKKHYPVEGIYAAALTPIQDDLSCHSKELASHCLDLLQRGCQGVVLFGTMGEGSSFSVAERIAVLNRVVEGGFPPEKIILGNGSSGISDSAQLALTASKLGCLSMLVSPPSFYKNLREQGVIQYYREVIQRVAHPNHRLILYHIPQYSGVPITLNIIQALLKEFPSIIIGMKESEGNLALTKSIIDQFPGFPVLIGHEKQIVEAISYGAAGSICGLANLYPELICSYYEAGKRSTKIDFQPIEAVMRALQGFPLIPACKAWMEHQKGSSWHQLRPPLLPLDLQERNVLLSKLPPELK